MGEGKNVLAPTHCEKTFFVLAFHPKNPLLRIENPAVDI
jgi:hypothetical protein